MSDLHGAPPALPLPDALQPWREWLDWFEPELQPAIGELVRRLHALFGRYRGSNLGGTPEPEGLGNLLRRGSYERLLGSEWLLAEEMPDEFLRRAAAGEHLFLAPQPRAHEAERLIVALFDAGPLQLGAPRLAHLAMCILLARRAREAGAELLWGVVQGDTLQPVDSAEALKNLLRARSWSSPSQAHWQHWQTTLDQLATRPGECWLISARIPGDVAYFSHMLQLKANLHGDALLLNLIQPSGSRSLSLPLPVAEAGVRLLKGAFQYGDRPAPLQHDSISNRLSLRLPPTFSVDGSRVAVPLLDDAGVMVLHIPAAGRKAGSPTRQHWGSCQPLAPAFTGKQIGALVQRGDHFDFWKMSTFFSPEARPSREVFDVVPGTARFLSAVSMKDNTCCWFYVLDRAGRLHHWKGERGNKSNSHSVIEEGVLALSAIDNLNKTLVYAYEKEGVLLLQFVCKGSLGARHSLGRIKGDKVLFGEGWNRGFGSCAVRRETSPAEIWRVFAGERANWSNREHDITLPPQWTAIGLAAPRATPADVGILALNRNGTRLIRVHSKGQDEVYAWNNAAVHAVVCPNSGSLALLTHASELIVFSIRDMAVSLFIHAGRAGNAAA